VKNVKAPHGQKENMTMVARAFDTIVEELKDAYWVGYIQSVQQQGNDTVLNVSWVNEQSRKFEHPSIPGVPSANSSTNVTHNSSEQILLSELSERGMRILPRQAKATWTLE
jgi:hypothetical protein